jgi:hypothetical protein
MDDTSADACRVGDPDATPSWLGLYDGEPCRATDCGYTCTRTAGHVGRQHVAGGGYGRVCHVWPWAHAAL